MSDKKIFYDCFFRIARPLIESASNGLLVSTMPVRGGEVGRRDCSNLEAISRLLCGLAPCLELNLVKNEDQRFLSYVHASRTSISSITNPGSDDFLNFNKGKQPLVDAAFLAQALYRAPQALWLGLSQSAQENVLNCLRSSRKIKPNFNNWLLFSAMIEAFFCSIGEEWDQVRVDYALQQYQQWYVGDGAYGDGPQFHWDYYNSFVIFPMLLDILEAVQGKNKSWDQMTSKVLIRAQRHAEVLERMIGPDGSYPLIGRSLAYRCGFLHVMAQLAWQQRLPASLNPGAVRAAMWAVIEKTLGRAENYDENGWLQIGINGHQPGVGENYISTGSLYLCSVAFLPLGLEESAPFWSLPEKPWTQRACFWLGQDMTLDKALK